MPRELSILIAGAGAVGLAIAGKLTDVADVTVLCRSYHGDAIASQGGVCLSGIWGARKAPVRAITRPEELTGPYDFILLTAKSQKTEELCTLCAPMMEHTPVASLQNGIGNEAIIAEFTDQPIGGTITTNFAVEGPGAVYINETGGPVMLGTYPKGAGTNTEKLAELFCQAGIETWITASINTEIWKKAIFNIAVNAPGAIFSCPTGDLKRTEYFPIVQRVVREAWTVAEAEGISLPWPDAEEYLNYLHSSLIPAFATSYASMYQDLTAGRTTEIAYLNGMIVELGEEHGIKTPCNACITHRIHALEEEQKKGKLPNPTGSVR